MKPLYSQEEFKNAKNNDLLPLQCLCCNETFYKRKQRIYDMLNPNNNTLGDFCSQKCRGNSIGERIVLNCVNCDKLISKTPSDLKHKKRKSKNNFCSHSCSASYNNKHKTTGNRRSKLEIWLEQQLILSYSNLEIHFNRKDTINSELDIYIPSLNLAFELNGIFHYEPIYGVNKLHQIKDNDISKSKACIENKIDLCIIDTSGQKYFKPSTSQKYLNIIKNIIKERSLTSQPGLPVSSNCHVEAS